MVNFEELRDGDILVDDELMVLIVRLADNGKKEIACRTWATDDGTVEGDCWIKAERFNPECLKRLEAYGYPGRWGVEIDLGSGIWLRMNTNDWVLERFTSTEGVTQTWNCDDVKFIKTEYRELYCGMATVLERASGWKRSVCAWSDLHTKYCLNTDGIRAFISDMYDDGFGQMDRGETIDCPILRIGGKVIELDFCPPIVEGIERMLNDYIEDL